MSTSVAACPVQLLLPCRHFFHSWHILKLFLSHFHCHFHTSCHTSATHDIFSNCYCHTFTVTFILLVILLPLMTSFQTVLVTLSLNVTFACNKTDKFILISIRFVVTLPSLLILLKLPVTIPLLHSVCNHHFVMVLLTYFFPLRDTWVETFLLKKKSNIFKRWYCMIGREGAHMSSKPFVIFPFPESTTSLPRWKAEWWWPVSGSSRRSRCRSRSCCRLGSCCQGLLGEGQVSLLGLTF